MTSSPTPSRMSSLSKAQRSRKPALSGVEGDLPLLFTIASHLKRESTNRYFRHGQRSAHKPAFLTLILTPVILRACDLIRFPVGCVRVCLIRRHGGGR